ncbi:hypothetical protein [Owenweeksia hongkongensis]|uniref:hypothetical protein n=1 Tax=Owenweeksia hongkongensis TaxID=253245 RepID=UPI0002E37A88|nr:hypothetical protein [Owenweeksia hongkongensis]
MKTFLSSLFFAISMSSYGQYFSADLTDESVPITWLGIDFTEARIIKKDQQVVDREKLSVLPNKWNDEVASQESKYPLKKAFHRSSITRDIMMMKVLNSELDAEQVITEDLYLLYNYSIKTAFTRYNLDGYSQGIGMVFLVEAIDYARKEFSGYMIPIDLVEKRIMKSYYLKTRFPYELEEEKLIEPFRQILLLYGEKLDEKK